MKNVRTLILLLILFLKLSIAYGQWPTANINSGNPAYPFPQFLEYAKGKTLAKYNAEGVTHADMEKAMREAYIMMTHRCRYSGDVLNGKKYITYNTAAVPFNYNTFCSEGDGYILIAAAYFADKETFDGLWLWMHDNRLSKVKRYLNCTDLRPAYRYGPFFDGWEADATTSDGSTLANSATDGDEDLAMGLLLAYKQWGEFMGINDACGKPISYKADAEAELKTLVDTLTLNNLSGGFSGILCGDIGIDGYVKSGNTWGENTSWRTSAANTTYPWAKNNPEAYTNSGLFTDYIAPAYYNEFATYLAANGGSAWQVNQYKRGEASSDWLISQMYAKGYTATSGGCTFGANDGSVLTFNTMNEGEDFRLSWRTILNYVWHGNQTTSWDPVNHAITATPNQYEYNMGIRHAGFLKTPMSTPTTKVCATMGASPDPACPTFFGPAQITQELNLNGTLLSQYRTNYAVGSGTPAAVASEDLTLIGDLYRQCEIMWDDASAQAAGLTDAQRYENSTPKYFHDWFRLLGMLTCSGNLQPPSSIKPIANIKVYMSVNKTYAYQGDNITYTVVYRNYGSLDATGVTLTTPLDNDYKFVSASKSGTLSGSTITWNIGTVPGFKSATGIPPTTDSVTFTILVKDTTNKRVCLQSTIAGTNTASWTSNEFPNHATYTMERNCVDILPARTLLVTKTADRIKMNPGDIGTFTVNFQNKSTANAWLNGGRSNVVVSYGNYYMAGNSYNFYQYYRIWHDASESYIDLHNYRMSYYMNDAAAMGLYSTTNTSGWTFTVDNQNDLDKYGYNPTTGPITFTYQKIPAGSDANGNWNQRLIVQFAEVLTAPATHIFDKLDNLYLIHKGVWGPGFIRTNLMSNPSSQLQTRVADDWSYSSGVTIPTLDGQNQKLTPITNNWADANNPNLVVNNYSRYSCMANVANYDRVLVEEWDGYTWRRILGRGPLPGREAYNVVITDTIPKNLKWIGFVDSMGLGVQATYTAAGTSASYTGIVKLTVPIMLVGDKDQLVYKASDIDPPCPSADKNFINAAWIQSQTDSPDSSALGLTITCTQLPPVLKPQTSLFKTANVTSAKVGDVVSYTLKYINTTGTNVVGNFSQSSDWKSIGNGNLPKFTSLASVTLDQNPNNPTNPPGTYGYAFYNVKSHGKNGYITSTIVPTNNSNVDFVFRYTAGTPGQSDFQGVMLQVSPNPTGNNTVNFAVIVNNTTLISETNVAFGGSYNPINIKVQLTDGSMYIYMNDFTGNPLKTYSGITNLNAGYAGIFGYNSQQYITSWKSFFDSSFDLSIFDPLPSALTSPTSISNSGTASGSKITWPTVVGPILANATYTYTFNATVASCTNFIANIGMALVDGIDTLKSLNVVTCGGSSCTAPTSVTLTANPTIAVCSGNTVTLTATAAPTGTWQYEFYKGTTVVQSASTVSTYNALTSGSYTVKIYNAIDSVGCAKTSSAVTVTVNPLPTITATSSPGKICVGSLATLTATGGSSYAWSNSIATASQTVNPTATITYTITGTDANGCKGTGSVALTVNALPTITASASPTSVCSGVPSTLTAGGGTSYIWSNSIATATQTVSPTATITYKVTGTDANSCSNTGSVTVTVTPPPTVSLSASPASICKGLSTTLTASGATTYAWNNSLPAGASNTASPTATTTYIVTGTSSGCTATATVTVTINTLPTITATASPTAVCAGSTTILKGSGGTTYSWSNGLGSGTTVTATPTATTTYAVTGADANGCTGTTSVAVTYTNPPPPTSNDTSVSVGAAVPLLKATGTGTIKWYDATGTTLLGSGASYTPSIST